MSGPICFSCQCPSTVKVGKLQKLGLSSVNVDKSIRSYLKMYGHKLTSGMIIRNSPENWATSEGIGFAGLICTNSNAKDIQESFWDIYMGRKNYHEKPGGVMAWKVDLDGKKLSTDSASDGDQDWILALMQAYEKIQRGDWAMPSAKTGLATKDDIKKEIQRLLTGFFDAHIKYKGNRYVYLATDGSWAQRGDGRDIYYASYPDPYALCMFSKFDTTHDWLKVSADVMDLNQIILDNYSDLGAKGQNPMPAKIFVSINPGGTFKVENYYTISSGEGVSGEDLKDNEEDSIRFFLRMARASVLSGNEKAQKILTKILEITKIQGVSDPRMDRRQYNNALAKAGYGIAAYGAQKTALAKLLLGNVQGFFDGEGYKDWDRAKEYYYYQSIIIQSILLGNTNQIVTPSIADCPIPTVVVTGKVAPKQLKEPERKARTIYPLYLITRTFGGAQNLAIYIDNGSIYVSTKKHPKLMLLITYKGADADKRARQTAESLKTIILKNNYSFLRIFDPGEIPSMFSKAKRSGPIQYYTLENLASKEVVAYQTEQEYQANKSAMPELIQKLFTLNAFTPYSWKYKITELLQKKQGMLGLPSWIGGDDEANVNLLMTLAKYYAYDLNYDKAIETYEEVMSARGGWKKYPNKYFEAAEELAMVHLYKSYSYLKDGTPEDLKKAGEQMDKSIQVYLKIISESNNYTRLASVYYNLAYVYYIKAVAMSKATPEGNAEYEVLLNKAIEAVNKAESYNTVQGETGIGRFRDKHLALKIKLFIGDVYMAKFNVYDPNLFESKKERRDYYLSLLQCAENNYKEAFDRETEIVKDIEDDTKTDKFEKKQKCQDFKSSSAEIRLKRASVDMQKWRFTETYPKLFDKTVYYITYINSMVFFYQALYQASELKDNIYFFSGSWEAKKVYYDVKIEEPLFEMEKYYQSARDKELDQSKILDTKSRDRAMKMINRVLAYLQFIPLASQKARAWLVKGEILMAEDDKKIPQTNKDEVKNLFAKAKKLLGESTPAYFNNFFERYKRRYKSVYSEELKE